MLTSLTPSFSDWLNSIATSDAHYFDSSIYGATFHVSAMYGYPMPEMESHLAYIIWNMSVKVRSFITCVSFIAPLVNNEASGCISLISITTNNSARYQLLMPRFYSDQLPEDINNETGCTLH